MSTATPASATPPITDKPHDCIALVLQGGGALGAYQAGVYEALSETAYRPDWVAGISIGAINAALIAGNPPERRVERLSQFWHQVSDGLGPLDGSHLAEHWLDMATELVRPRTFLNEFSALRAATLGIPGFYKPRMPPALLQPNGAPEALSLYDTTPLRATLEALVDFDLINSKRIRLSIGAVNVRTGNAVFFDNTEHTIRPEHVMASGALPPAFPPVEIDGEHYWDGGLLSNTPLQYVLDMRGEKSLLALQVDLFNARGCLPGNLADVQQRQKDILYSSRTRFNSNMAAKVANTRKALADLLMKLPQELKDDASVQVLAEAIRPVPTDIVHLIYRQAAYELESKDYEFSRVSVLEHWNAGRRDMCDTIGHPEWLKVSGLDDGVTQYDLTRKARADHSSHHHGEHS